MGDEYRMKRSLYELGCMIVASVSASMEADTMEEQATFDAGTEMNINELKRRDAAHAALEAQLADADEVMAGQVARARAAYEQRCAELEAQLSAMEWVAKTHAEQSEAKSRRIAALEAQLAETQAEIDPELLTAAWLHGADHARRKARWPTGDAAAEQLARAVTEARQFDRQMWGYPVRAWESYSPESQAEFIAQAAAVLRRLREQGGGEDAS